MRGSGDRAAQTPNRLGLACERAWVCAAPEGQDLMKHFELVEWTDFVRGLVEESARVAMERHLASGCRKCRHTAELLHKAGPPPAATRKCRFPSMWFAKAIGTDAP